MSVVVPTILAVTPADYAERLDRVKSFAARLHVDVSDGEFAPGKTVGLARVYDLEGIPLDLHLMQTDPARQLEDAISLQPNLITWHYESAADHVALSGEIQAFDIKVGLAVLPQTDLAVIRPLLSHFDHVLIFAGHLGANGGSFDEAAVARIQQIRAWAPQIEIGVDGGVNAGNARACVQAGADVLYVGSAIHDAADPASAYREIIEAAG